MCEIELADCLRQILHSEGLGALWSGTSPSLLLATNPAIHFMVYEALKRYAMRGGRKVRSTCTLSTSV